MAEKRKTADNNSQFTNKKIKNNEDDDDDQDYENAMAEGTYTSQFPDLVIYQILLLLPFKLATRASLLSKQWAQVWSTVSLLDIDEDKQSSGDGSLDDRLQRRKFIKFARKCFKDHKELKHLDKLRLSMRYLGGKELMEKWLSFAVERNVQDLDISLVKLGAKYSYYYLSPRVLNAKSLTILNLEKVKIKDNDSISLPSLKTMSLKDVGLNQSAFAHLISGCPSIECLSLTSITLVNGYSFSPIHVSSSSLKFLEIMRMCSHQVEAMNLQSLRFSGNQTPYYSWYKNTCPMLRNLEFLRACIAGSWFKDHITDSRFPLLESLILRECHSASDDVISIFSQNLRSIVFCGNWLKTKINTPNLLSIRFSGLYLKSKLSLNAPNLSQATINLWDKKPNIGSYNYHTLRNFLGNFDCPGNITLSVNDAEALMFPEERRAYSPPLPSLKHLSVEINSPTELRDAVSRLRDSLCWMAPSLDSLSIKINSLEVLYEQLGS